MSRSMDDILQLDGAQFERMAGAIADFALLTGGRVVWRLWPDDPDTAYVVQQMTAHGHLFVVSEDPADLHAAIARVRL